MSDALRTFFESVPSRVDAAKLKGVHASYRFDVADVGSWRMVVSDGAVSVAESSEPADCVIAASEKTLTKIVRGEQNPATAVMLGKLKVDGDMTLALKLKDLL